MKRFLSLILVLLVTLSALPMTVGAANTTVKNQIDLPLTDSDDFGSGYEWDNLDCVLKLNGIRLDTTDEFGIKLPAGSTIELTGNNYVKASTYAIYALGALTFTGKGSLTLVSAENGITCFTTLSTDNLVFRSGEISISGAKNGIYSENTPILFSGTKININASENAIFGKDIKFVSGDITLSERIYAKGSVTVSNTELSVSSKSSAIKAGKDIAFADVKILAGNSLSSVAAADSYNGENAIKTVGTKKVSKNGFLFGGKLPAFVDYIVIAVIALALVAVIIVPIIIKRKKTLALIKQSETARATSGKKSKKK